VPIGGRSVGIGPASGVIWLVHWHDIRDGWAQDAGRQAPPSDVYHGHDLDGLAAAIHARALHGRGTLVYDCHDLLLGSAASVARPGWARAILALVTRRWVAQADRVVTVTGAMAAELVRHGSPEPVVVRNCARLWEPQPGDRTRLRAAAGIAEGRLILLNHGGLTPHRGIELLVDALDRPGFDQIDLVLMGAGSLRAWALERARANPRIHVVDPVPPDELLPWVSGADIGVVLSQPLANQLVTLPNKLFDWLMTGVPVVASDFPPFREIVLGDPLGPLGRVCDPTDPSAVADAILGLAADLRADPSIRDRCRRAALERYNWEREVLGLLGLYRDLAADDAPGPPGSARAAATLTVPGSRVPGPAQHAETAAGRAPTA